MAEPVAWMDGQGNLYRYPDDADRGQTMRPLYLEREWMGLTGQEINHIFAANVGYPERMMEDVEAKLKEKNT